MTSDRVSLRGRLVEQRSGAPMGGQVQVVGSDGAAAATLDGVGRFAVDLARGSASFAVVDDAGRRYAVDASGSTPSVAATPAGGRLVLDYAGDPDMAGQTPDSIAVAARADASAARATADAAQGATVTLSAAVALLTTSMQAVLAASQAVAARRVALVAGRAAVPNLAVGVEKPLAVTWSPAPPVAPTSTLVLLEPTGSLLGQVTASVKADSVTATGATVLLRAPLSVALGAGSVVVVGAYLT